MKKIKFLLLGIVSLLGIGFSFASTGVNSTFSYIDGYNHTFTNINGMNPRCFYNYIGYDWYSSGSKFVQINSFNSTSYTGFYRSFYSSNGIKLNYYSDDYIFFNLGTINQSLLFTQQSDYLNYDGFPLVYDSFGNYLTFSGDNQIIYNGNIFDISNVHYLQYCFYGTDFNLSCLFSDSVNDPGYKFKSFDVNNNSVDQYNNIAIIPLHEIVSDTGAGYFSGSLTLVLSYGNYNSMQNLGIIYNLYNCYSSDPDILQNCNINSKGYININNDTFFHRNFLTLLSPVSANQSLILGSFAQIFYHGGHFYFRNNSSLYKYGSQSTSAANIPKNCYDYNNCYMQGELDLVVDNSVDDLISVSTPISTGNSVSPYSSWYYQCLGPTYQTPDGLPPAFCLNPDGTLIDYDLYRDCYNDISVNSEGLLENHFFCNIGGFIQEMNWVAEGSGGSFVPCSGDSCGTTLVAGPDYLSSSNFELSTGLVLDMITNLTGWVAKCPFPYTDFQLGKNSSLLRYLKSLGFSYDPFIFINCAVAGFHYGRHTIDNQLFGDTFEHPLLYGDTQKHNSLFVFLDFIVILGLLGLFAFLKRLF